MAKMGKYEECGKCAEEDAVCKVYSNEATRHFIKPRNSLKPGQKPSFKPDGYGKLMGTTCGDMINIWIKLDSSGKRIKKCQWQSFGCAASVASTSMLSVMVTEKGGMLIEKALSITPKTVVDMLKGLPKIKVHCSVLAIQVLRAAIADAKQKLARKND